MTDDQSPPPQSPAPPPVAPPPPAVPAMRGQVGQSRSAGMTILLTFVTCGIWHLAWTYWAFEENKSWAGEGVGGLVGLLLAFVCGIVNWFLLPSEIEKIYLADGRESPVTALTGLWVLLPLAGFFVWQFKVQGALNDFWVSKGAVPA